MAARTTLAVVAALGILTAFMGQGFADQARTSSASAYGLEATGAVPVARTPTASATAPPDGTVENNATLKVPAATAAVDATLVARADAFVNDSVVPFITSGRGLNAPAPNSEFITIERANSRGYASAKNLRVLIRATSETDCNATPQLCIAAVTADAVESEAVARCVNNVPNFDTGWNLLTLEVLDIDLDDVAAPLLDVVTGLLGPGGPVNGIIPLATIEKGVTRELPDNGQGAGRSITALEIRVLNQTQVVRVAHSEARMPTNCAVTASPSPSPAARLAQTGGGGMSAVLGGSLLAGAVLMMVFVRKYRFSE